MRKTPSPTRNPQRGMGTPGRRGLAEPGRAERGQTLPNRAQSYGFASPGPLVLQLEAVIPASEEVLIEQPKLYGLQ